MYPTLYNYEKYDFNQVALNIALMISMNLVCTKHLIISLQIASSPVALPFFKRLEALMIFTLLVPLSNISLDVGKSFALFIMLSITLSDPQGVDCGLLSF